MTMDQASTQRWRYTRLSRGRYFRMLSTSRVWGFLTMPVTCTVQGRGRRGWACLEGAGLSVPDSQKLLLEGGLLQGVWVCQVVYVLGADWSLSAASTAWGLRKDGRCVAAMTPAPRAAAPVRRRRRSC